MFFEKLSIIENNQKRADQIIKLLQEISVPHPIRIDLSKITQSVFSIDLAWILAFCAMHYDSIKNIEFKDSVLNSLQKDMYKKLHASLISDSQRVSHVEFFEEADFVNKSKLSKSVLSYVVLPKIACHILKRHKEFEDFIVTATQKRSDKDRVKISVTDEDLWPSNKGAAKTAVLKQALQSIAIKIKNPNLNREILWNQLFELAKDPGSSIQKKDMTTLIEVVTKNEWDRAKANQHLDAVIAWYKSTLD